MKFLSRIVAMITPYMSRLVGIFAAAITGYLSVKLGWTAEMTAENATAVTTLLMGLSYALTHKTTSKATNPSDDATSGKTD